MKPKKNASTKKVRDAKGRRKAGTKKKTTPKKLDNVTKTYRIKVIDPSVPLEDSQHEMFCQTVFGQAGSQNATEAYAKAYPKASRKTAEANASRLLRNAKVSARIDWLKRQAAERVSLTMTDKRCGFCGTINDAHHSAECVDRREAAIRSDFDRWWTDEGIEKSFSTCDHPSVPLIKQLCEIAWSNGAYKALDNQ